jgi:peptide chain release factor 1
VIEPFFRGGDAFLQRAHVGGERRLVAHRRGNAAEQRRDLRARLGEAEDVVDEQQHVLAFLVAEIFREGEAGQAHAGARARRLVHLPVHQRRLRARAVQLDDARFDHLVVQVVALARALAHAGEHRIAAMRLGDVVDQLHDDDGLAHAGAAEQADLAALGVGREQIDHLDARHQHLRLGGLVRELGRRAVDREELLRLDRPALVHRLADDVDDAAQRLGAHRHGDRPARVGDRLAAHQPLGRVHGDGAHGVLAQMLRHFQHQLGALVVGVQRVQDRRQFAVEAHVHHRAHHLGDAAGGVLGALGLGCRSLGHGSAPDRIP